VTPPFIKVDSRALQALWEACDQKETTREKDRLENAFIASLSHMVPREIWDRALETAIKATK
jgi:hypothetical protein